MTIVSNLIIIFSILVQLALSRILLTTMLLGEPKYEHNTRKNKKIYTYYAGTMRKEWFFGKCYTTDYYEPNICFDSNKKVEHTNIKINP